MTLGVTPTFSFLFPFPLRIFFCLKYFLLFWIFPLLGILGSVSLITDSIDGLHRHWREGNIVSAKYSSQLNIEISVKMKMPDKISFFLTNISCISRCDDPQAHQGSHFYHQSKSALILSEGWCQEAQPKLNKSKRNQSAAKEIEMENSWDQKKVAKKTGETEKGASVGG